MTNENPNSLEALSRWLDDENEGIASGNAEGIDLNASNAIELAKAMAVHGLLSEISQHDQQSESELVQAALESAFKAEPNAEASLGLPTLRGSSKGISRSFWISLSLAACLLIAFGLSLLPSMIDPAQPVIQPFASVSQIKNIEFDDTETFEIDDRLGAQTIRIAEGFMRLLFDDGVEVTLQGPAVYELIAPGKTKLLTGLLTATVPPGAEGFRVQIPDADVIDLGTAFGIELLESGESNVTVFDGEVEVVPRSGFEGDGNIDRTRLLKEGEAVNVSAGSIKSVEFDVKQFEKAWPVSSGVAGSTGAFQFAPQWPRRLSQVQSDEKIFVVPEGYSKRLRRNLAVDIVEPGLFRSEDELVDEQISAGQRIKSYLLQFNPVDRGVPAAGQGRDHNDDRPAVNRKPGRRSGGKGAGGRNGDLKRIIGEITFDRPVIGLIVRTPKLDQSDTRFSRSRKSQYARQLELNGHRKGDSITLSEDRLTVKLDVAAVGRRYDHVRVIVDASIEKRKSKSNEKANQPKKNQSKIK